MATNDEGSKREADEASTEKRDFHLEVFAAVLLGIATVFGAYAAYQSSLWGGNCLTAYTEAGHKLAEANREMLRAVQEQSFDAVVWIENMKAHEVAAAAAAHAEAAHAEAAHADAEHAEAAHAEPAAAAAVAPEPTEDQRAQEIVQEMDYSDELSLPQKLAKLQKARTHLNDATKWADETYKKRMAALQPKDKLEIAKRILAYEKELAAVEQQEMALAAKLGAVHDDVLDEEVLATALAKDEKAKTELAALDVKWRDAQSKIDHEFERLAKPLFFESPDYTKKQEASYKKLQAEGNKLMEDGQKYNVWGDKFTKVTVDFTIVLFFAGLASVLKRFPIRVAFVSAGLVVFVFALVQMLKVPFA